MLINTLPQNSCFEVFCDSSNPQHQKEMSLSYEFLLWGLLLLNKPCCVKPFRRNHLDPSKAEAQTRRACQAVLFYCLTYVDILGLIAWLRFHMADLAGVTELQACGKKEIPVK